MPRPNCKKCGKRMEVHHTEKWFNDEGTNYTLSIYWVCLACDGEGKVSVDG